MKDTQKDKLKDVATYLIGIEIELAQLRILQPKTSESEEAHAQATRLIDKAKKVLKEIYDH